MNLLRRIAQHLDPRQPFARAHNTSVQMAYLGLATQSILLVYLSIHFILSGAGSSWISIIFNLFSVFALLDLGVTFLKGRRQSQLWGGFFCAIQATYYYGLTNPSKNFTNVPTLVIWIGLISCVATAFLLFSKSTKVFLSQFDDSFFN